jgi:restriction system protein
MLILEIAFGIVVLIAAIHFWITKRQHEYRTSLITQHMESSLELKKTLAMGLYLRFCDDGKNTDGKPNKYSKIFIKQTPIQFETFVAEVMEKYYGGSAWVSPASGDYGVDFEHRREDGLYLGQVKCYKNDLSYEPIALLHSNIIKSGAKGGYIITTGSFSENARKFTQELNIELIDGVKLVEYWIYGLKQTENTITQFEEVPTV